MSRVRRFKVKVLHHNVIEFLEKEGFKPSTSGLSLYDCDLFYYKRTKHEDTKECVCNYKLPQICVKAYSCNEYCLWFSK